MSKPLVIDAMRRVCYNVNMGAGEQPMFITVIDNAGREKRQGVEYARTEISIPGTGYDRSHRLRPGKRG